MVIYCESGDLLDELEEVDGAVEEGWFEFAFEVDVVAARFVALHVVGEVYESDDVDGELAENGANDVRVKDIGLGPFFGETFDRLLEVCQWERVKGLGPGGKGFAYLCT